MYHPQDISQYSKNIVRAVINEYEFTYIRTCVVPVNKIIVFIVIISRAGLAVTEHFAALHGVFSLRHRFEFGFRTRL